MEAETRLGYTVRTWLPERCASGIAQMYGGVVTMLSGPSRVVITSGS